MLRHLVAALGVLGAVAASQPLYAQSLAGSPHSLTVQNREARAHDYTYLRNRSQIRHFIELGLLVKIPGNADYRLHAVSYPYARPEVKVFIQRLASQYRAACGERLVVTSLVRPESMHLWNSSRRTVHPTGMAMDLRRSDSASCRRWIEDTLLSLEGQGVLEATREHHPPHYHVALFPHPYYRYLAALGETPKPGSARSSLALADDTGVDSDDDGAASAAAGDGSEAADVAVAEDAQPGAGDAQPGVDEAVVVQQASLVPHEVLRGETLWGLARTFGTTVTALLDVNGLRSPEIKAGQVLQVPAPTRIAAADVGGGRAEPVEEPTYRVDSGDSLWSIARQHGTTVDAIKRANGLSGSRIQAGQVLKLPSTGR